MPSKNSKSKSRSSGSGGSGSMYSDSSLLKSPTASDSALHGASADAVASQVMHGMCNVMCAA
jgi:hypothetical protein